MAALLAALLSLFVFGEEAQAGRIVNTAYASWMADGVKARESSNEVALDVIDIPPQIVTLVPAPGTGTPKPFPIAQCYADGQGRPADPAEVQSRTTAVRETDTLRAGEDLYFEITAVAANRNPEAVDSLHVIVTAASGDREELTVYETGVDTGLFGGTIATMRRATNSQSGDCRLGLVPGDMVTVAVVGADDETVVIQTNVEILADPFGIVFDSETGMGVDGARVTLIDAATGLPAVVFAEDGVTPWPSTVISGSLITDGAGNTYQMESGEYWFPLTALGTYYLQIEPPAPYTAPSVVSPEEIARLTREDGRDFIIADASYGGSLALVDATAVQIDIPLDRAGLGVSLTKTASRAAALPGDAVFYSIIVTNPDADRTKRSVTVTDTPSPYLRLRSDTVRIDGEAAPEAISITPDGRVLTARLGDLPGGASRRVTYAMVVRADAPPGDAINRAVARDTLGRETVGSAVVDIQRDMIADRMTIIGRVTAGSCAIGEERPGIPNVRVMMEDGSFAITDADGRYHFDGVVPGTHVVQASAMTLPQGGQFIDCQRDTRGAGSASSRFAIGQGGSLVRADFQVQLPDVTLRALKALEAMARAESNADAHSSEIEGRQAGPETAAEVRRSVDAPQTDWIAKGDGPNGFLSPEEDANPRSPSIKVAVRHRQDQTIELLVDGKPVDGLAYDGIQRSGDGAYAVSRWRGVPLVRDHTRLEARLTDEAGVVESHERGVWFTTKPRRVELVREKSKLVADGRTRPVVAIRVLDRNDRPLREGVSGQFTLNAPYESAARLEQQQLDQLTGSRPSSAQWTVANEDGIAFIELAPTMVSGSLTLDFRFDDGEISRSQQLEAWIEPGDIDWTVIALGEGTIGARSVAQNMERDYDFESDLGEDARVALYAKGRVLGKYLVTLAYDSAKQRDDQRLLGTIDPNAYYTVFADASSRRFDAASREKLYVRIETASFYALYGDFETGFDQTRLTRYQRIATGLKAEARLGRVRAEGFAADIGTRLRRDEIQGQGISGPYALRSRRIVANSETVTLETRDRFRSELIVDRRTLTRFIDYDLDLLSGTIRFKQPVLSRDFDLNPQFIVVDYEVDELGEGELNAGVRASFETDDQSLRIGASYVTDKGDGPRTDLAGIDVRARFGNSTEVRAELAVSNREGNASTGWSVEAEHVSGKLDLLAYARELDAEYGIGQQNGVELGRRKIGVDARVRLTEQLSITGSAWQDESLTEAIRRRAAQIEVGYQGETTGARVGISHFTDSLPDATTNTSTVLESGVSQRLLGNKLELDASTSIALDDTASIDLPSRHRFGARYALTNNVRVVGLYEIATGDNIDARTLSGGFEVIPWQGAQVVSSLGKRRIDESGDRAFAAFGLSQTLQVSPALSVDVTVDGSRTLNGTPPVDDVVNPDQPVASGGQLTAGSLFEDFTAISLGASWREGRWSATGRAEYRDGEFANRKGATLAAIRQVGEGSVVGSGLTWTKADGLAGASTEIIDAAIGFAHRPARSAFASLGKLEYRSDRVAGGIAGVAGPTGRTALDVTGDALALRLVGSLSTNWNPRGEDDDREVRRTEIGVFLGGRYNFDAFEGLDLSTVTALLGFDARFGIGERIEIGGTANVRAGLDDGTTNFALGPQVGLVPVDGMLLTLGYNIDGFRDPDFEAARYTNQGLYAAVRIKLDADTFGFLGLGR